MAGQVEAGTFFLWMMIIFATVISGYVGYKTIRLASIKINQWVMEYYAGYYNANPFKSFTALGEITKLKLSDKNERIKEHINAFGNLERGGCFVFGVEKFVPVGIQEERDAIIQRMSLLRMPWP